MCRGMKVVSPGHFIDNHDFNVGYLYFVGFAYLFFEKWNKNLKRSGFSYVDQKLMRDFRCINV